MRRVAALAVTDPASKVRVELNAPPPDAGRMPWRDVFLVLRAIRAAGVETIHLQGPLPPR